MFMVGRNNMTSLRSVVKHIYNASETLGLVSVLTESSISCLEGVIVKYYHILVDDLNGLGFGSDLFETLSDLVSRYKGLLDAYHIDY